MRNTRDYPNRLDGSGGKETRSKGLRPLSRGGDLVNRIVGVRIVGVRDRKTKSEVLSVGEVRLQGTSKKAITVLLTQMLRGAFMKRAEMSPATLKQGVKVTVLGVVQPSGEIVAREIQLPAPVAAVQASVNSGYAH